MKSMDEGHFAILRRHMVEVIGIHVDLLGEELVKPALEERVLATMAAMPNRAPPPSPAPAATRSPSPFTAPERDLIRRELHPRFGQDPSIADGIMLRTWRSGPNAGQPKLPPAVQSLIERGLVVVRTDGRWPAAHFTEAGLAALHRLAQDRRALDPGRYAHVRRELGLDAGDGNTAGEVDSSGTRAGGA